MKLKIVLTVMILHFMHTLYKLNDDDEFEFDFKYSRIPINPIGTWYGRGDFVFPLASR